MDKGWKKQVEKAEELKVNGDIQIGLIKYVFGFFIYFFTK